MRLAACYSEMLLKCYLSYCLITGGASSLMMDVSQLPLRVRIIVYTGALRLSARVNLILSGLFCRMTIGVY
jgi:hypothetical protein